MRPQSGPPLGVGFDALCRHIVRNGAGTHYKVR